MPPNAKSNRRKKKKDKFIQKLKQPWRVKESTRNWLELPSDLMLNILQRLGVIDRLDNAQLVCTAWREICKDPSMWRVINMDIYSDEELAGRFRCRDMCKHAIERSQGQLVDLTMVGFCDNNLLHHLIHRSSQVRRLEIAQYIHEFNDMPREVFVNLPLLEELSFAETTFWKENVEVLGHHCPYLKTLKLNQKAAATLWDDRVDVESMPTRNGIALAIAKYLPDLTHLELIGNSMTNTGLHAILDGCCHLESLDLRRCWNIDLTGDLEKRCSQQITNLKLPHDSIKGYPYTHVSFEYYSDIEYLDCLDFTAYDNDNLSD